MLASWATRTVSVNSRRCRSEAGISTTFQPFPLYLAAAGIYWGLSLAFERLQRHMERRLAFPH